MLRRVVLLAVLAIWSNGLPAFAAAAEPAPIIVVLLGAADAPRQIDALEQGIGFVAEFRYQSAFAGFAGRVTASQRAMLARDPRVELIAADRTVRATALHSLMPGEAVPLGVRRIGAGGADRAEEAATSSVAIVDTGIDLSHPELRARDGRNCVRHRPASDDNGHGTHVAGIIGARNSGQGIVGAAPGTLLYAVKVLDASGAGTLAQLLCGLDWISANAGRLGIAVANLSLSSMGRDDGACGAVDGDVLHRAVCAVTAGGVTVVAAAGNGATNLATRAPAGYREVLAVTAMSDTDGTYGGSGPVSSCSAGDVDDAAAMFSNFADAADAQHVIAAPGVCIGSTWLDGRYATASGTSAAAAHVSAAVALCIGTASGAGPCAGLTPSGVMRRVREDASGRPCSEGFLGDPCNPSGSRYYGNLVRGGY